MICCNQYKNEAFIQCGSTCDPSDHQPDRMICCNSYTCAASLHCGQACDFSDPAQLNDFLLASVCFFRVPASLNYLLHLLHLCGFSPVWKSMCLLRFPAWLNDLLQMVHLCGFSPMCVMVCFLRTSARLNDVSHCSQMCSSLPYGWSCVYLIVLFLSTVNQQVLFQNSSTTKWFETMRTRV